MKLSIWQQFSSNHSSHFTVVGRFETEKRAQEVANEFSRIFTAIQESRFGGWKNHKESVRTLSPFEEEFSRELDIDWGATGIDWIGEDSVKRIQRDVLISVDFETWSPPTPILNLMRHFGAKPHKQFLNLSSAKLSVHLTCEFPDEKQASIHEQLVYTYFEDEYDDIAVPWNNLSIKHSDDISGNGTARVSKKILLIDCQFFLLHYGLLAMVDWLQEIGAKKIEYTLTEEAEWPPQND